MMTMGHACLYAYVQDHHKNLGISDCAHQSCICIIRSPLTALSLFFFCLHFIRPTNWNTASIKTETVCGNPDLQDLGRFCDLVGAIEADGYEIGVSKGKWTLFVPNDDAFDDLGNTLDDLSNDDAKKLILFHFVKGKVLHAEELPCTTGDNLSEMANGIDTRTLCDEYGPFGQKGGGNINGPAGC